MLQFVCYYNWMKVCSFPPSIAKGRSFEKWTAREHRQSWTAILRKLHCILVGRRWKTNDVIYTRDWRLFRTEINNVQRDLSEWIESWLFCAITLLGFLFRFGELLDVQEEFCVPFAIACHVYRWISESPTSALLRWLQSKTELLLHM